MAASIYALCAITACVCALLLFRAYRSSRNALLLWSSVCFFGLTASNALLIIDKLVVPDTDLSPWRHGITLVSLIIFVYGLLWNSER